MKKELFGTMPTGERVYKYTISNDSIEISVLDRGATLASFRKCGIDIVGGFDSLAGYLADDSHQGATVGRVANRIENARFVMDGNLYRLPKNNGNNCLHGGVGFDYRMWEVIEFREDRIVLEYTADDGEEGFPSALTVDVSYTIKGSELIIDYIAAPHGKTPISLTNHSYFNLDGFGGDVFSHKVKIYADSYTAVSDTLIPTGEHPSVEGTPFDFREFHEIGERIGGDFGGYDHNYPLKPSIFEKFGNRELGLAAVVLGKSLKLSVFTDQPGVQFYTANFLGKGPDFKGGIKQRKHGAFCLETQTEPNSVNHGIGFYEKGEVYTHRTVYRVENNI